MAMLLRTRKSKVVVGLKISVIVLVSAVFLLVPKQEKWETEAQLAEELAGGIFDKFREK